MNFKDLFDLMDRDLAFNVCGLEWLDETQIKIAVCKSVEYDYEQYTENCDIVFDHGEFSRVEHMGCYYSADGTVENGIFTSDMLMVVQALRPVVAEWWVDDQE